MQTSSPTSGALIRQRLKDLDDSEVVNSFLGGEDRAFEELVNRYTTRLINFIYRTTGDRDKAEDLVQEVFIRVFRHIHRFDRSKKFSTWVYTIASNLAKNELRNRSRNPVVLFQTIQINWDSEDRPLQFEDVRARPDDLYRKRHLRELVEETVARLPEHHREVFSMRELEGKTYEEIAEITDTTLGTVKSRLNRARSAFFVTFEATEKRMDQRFANHLLPDQSMPATKEAPAVTSGTTPNPESTRTLLKALWTWWPEIPASTIYHGLTMKTKMKMDEFENLYAQIDQEMKRRKEVDNLPDLSFVKAYLPDMKRVAEWARQGGAPNVPAIPGEEAPAKNGSNPSNHNGNGTHNGKPKQQKSREQLDEEREDIRSKLKEYLLKHQGVQIFQGQVYNQFVVSHEMTLVRNEFDIIFAEVQAEIRQEKRTGAKSLVPPTEERESKRMQTRPADLPAPPPRQAPSLIEEEDTTAPAPILEVPESNLKADGSRKHGRLPTPVRKKLQEDIKEVIRIDPNVTPGTAFRFRTWPLGQGGFTHNFHLVKQEMIDAGEITAPSEPAAPAGDDLKKPEQPSGNTKEAAKADSVEAEIPAAAVEDTTQAEQATPAPPENPASAVVRKEPERIRIRLPGGGFDATQEDGGGWYAHFHAKVSPEQVAELAAIAVRIKVGI